MKLSFPIALALVACCAAQELTSSNGDITMDVTRRQTISVTQLQSTVTAQAAQISSLTAAVSRLEDTSGPVALGIRSIADDMVTRTQGLLVQTTQNNVRLSSVENSMSATVSSLTAQAAALNAAVSTSLASAESDMESRAVALESALSTSMSTQTATIDSRITATLGAVSTAVQAMNSTTTRMLTRKADAAIHMWSGGCSSGPGSGWNEFCLNRVEIDTGRPKFQKQTNTRFISTVAMYFQFEFYNLKQSSSWAHSLLYIDGNHRTHSQKYFWNPWHSSHWSDEHVMMTYRIANRKQFYARSYTRSWTSFHTSAHHSRVTVIYKGPYNA